MSALGLARLPGARLARSRRGWAVSGAWFGLGLAAAIVARHRGASHGADVVLLDAYGAVVLPLLAYTIVGTVLATRSLSAAIAPVTAFGASPRGAAATALGVATAGCILACAAAGSLFAVVAHGPADPPIGQDLLASGYASALGGASYATWFGLGASFGPRGVGRIAFLVADWLLAGVSGATALVSPRAHVTNLLGGPAPMDLSQRTSALLLVGLAIACGLLATLRAKQG